MNFLHSKLYLPPVILFVCTQIACSLIGYGIGTAIDKKSEEKIEFSHIQNHELISGTSIQFYNKNGEMYSMDNPEYDANTIRRPLKKQFDCEEHAWIPVLYEKVYMIFKYDSSNGSQKPFDVKKVSFLGMNHVGILIGLPESNKTCFVPFQKFYQLADSTGKTIESIVFYNLVKSNKIPPPINLSNTKISSDSQLLNMDYVIVNRSTSCRTYGCVVGAALDAAVVYSLATGLEIPLITNAVHTFLGVFIEIK